VGFFTSPNFSHPKMNFQTKSVPYFGTMRFCVEKPYSDYIVVQLSPPPFFYYFIYYFFHFFPQTPFNAYNNISNITRVFRRQSALVWKLQGPTKIQYCLVCFVYNFFFIFYTYSSSVVKKDRRFSFQISSIFISGRSNLTPATCTFTRLRLNKVLFFKVGKGMWKGGT